MQLDSSVNCGVEIRGFFTWNCGSTLPVECCVLEWSTFASADSCKGEFDAAEISRLELIQAVELVSELAELSDIRFGLSMERVEFDG